MKPKAIFARLLLLTGAVAIAAFGYSHREQILATPEIAGQIQGLSSRFDLDSATLLSQAQKKLVDQQPIMVDPSPPVVEGTEAGVVMGTSVSDQAKQVIQEQAEKVFAGVKQLPKDQASQAVRQICEQIINELESESNHSTQVELDSE
jgi:hypothetical protein